MTEESEVEVETDGTSRWRERAKKTYDVVRKGGLIALLYGILYWLIVESPIPARASVADSSGFLLTAAVLSLFVGSCLFALAVLYGRRTTQAVRTERVRTLYKAFRAIAIVTILFSGSLWLVAHTSLTPPALGANWAGALLTAASLALFIFAILIALATAIGWPSLKQYIRRRVDNAVEPLRSELRGRSLSNTGYALGELSLKDTFEVERPALLDLAVESCRRGYLQLERAEDGPRLMALNNWLYYMTFKEGPAEDPDFLEHARELYKVGVKSQIIRLQLTYCRVVARYLTAKSHEEWTRAMRTIQMMCKKSPPYQTLSQYDLKEAEFCQKLFGETPAQFTEK